MNSEGIQLYIYMYPLSPKLSSHPGCHITLSTLPVLHSRSLLVLHFKYSSVYMSIPNSLTVPSRYTSHTHLCNRKFLLYFYFVSKFICIISFLDSTYNGCQMIFLFCLTYFTQLFFFFNSSVGFPGGSVIKNPPANTGDAGSIPGSGRSLGERNGNPPQCSCLGNPMNRGAWWVTVRGIARFRHDLATKQQQLLKSIICYRYTL